MVDCNESQSRYIYYTIAKSITINWIFSPEKIQLLFVDYVGIKSPTVFMSFESEFFRNSDTHLLPSTKSYSKQKNIGGSGGAAHIHAKVIIHIQFCSDSSRYIFYPTKKICRRWWWGNRKKKQFSTTKKA